MPHKPSAPDVVGKRFGPWTVLSFAEIRRGKRNHYYWHCRCDCGADGVIATSNLKAIGPACNHRPAKVKPTPNELRDRAKARAARSAAKAERLEARRRHGYEISERAMLRRRHPGTLRSWQEMIRRCTQPTSRDYPNYGGRGVTVCDRWLHSFENFLADMGPRTDGMSIDRKDVNASYEPSNCRWATATEQNRNSRHSVLTVDLAQEVLGRVEHGESRSSVARRMGISDAVVYTVVARRAWRDLEPLAA